jgi:hypothetical protein
VSYRFRGLLLISLVGSILACHRDSPDRRATEILQNSAGDYEYEHKLWMKDRKNWDLGMKSALPWAGPDSKASVETIRDLRTEDLVSCAPKGPSPSVYFQTSVSLPKTNEGPVALFHWATIESATAGQKQVQGAVETSHGDAERLYAEIQRDPTLDKACARFFGKRDLCAKTASSD